ncbi:SDR family NAD(P)-dependent oxidoreductase [Microbacterium trichothecenolyticum]|uniref:SDR family NAD(P)-dependent oxidoreductase n=1 Tax=Microbacterium trichothecenolyticum TaxID=69370 RepID=UPI001C6E9A41|nr:SDR family NAD(P)-dependent oxidoreductase [Microbacterium trichothecenolyticum]MBW9118561.1 SDR family NAD(P)-dependent oxidoreductase [Microbacterium trichothecenolyticum]
MSPARRPEVVVITGASSGIGRATARAYARRGARLVLASRSRAALETVAEECRAHGARALVVPTDVSVEAQVQALAEAAVAQYGRIDVWVGNAGVFAYGSFDQLPPGVFRQVVETNLMGQVHGARAALPHFRRQGTGTLVMIASLYSRVASPGISPYVTSKYGVLGFAEALRQELRGSGIRIRLIIPGAVDTPIYQHAANVTGRRARPLPPAASPDRVARAIIRSAGRRRFAAYVGGLQRLVLPVHDFAPGFYDAIASVLMDRFELHGTSSVSFGTVLEAPGRADPTTGGWRSARLRLALATGVGAAVAAFLARRR